MKTLLLTYAEMHYRPRFVPSIIYKKQPEIIFDAPERVDPGRPIPLFIFIKDAHRFPVQIDSIVVHALYEGGVERIARFPYHGLDVRLPLWWDSLNIVPEFTGAVKIIPYVLLRRGKKTISICVDNYRGTSHRPLNVYAATSPLPGMEGWFHGDIHCHTYYTSDQIEFGAPLEALALAGFSMGMHWIAATDHSYDLDDYEMDNMSQEPLLRKWRVMRNMARFLEKSFTIIPGEEVTCRTQKGSNCHLLALDSERFIKGSGDSGKNYMNTHTENSIGRASSMCLEWGGLSCAAHPMEKIPLLERLFLNRGKWSLADLQTPGINAMQIHNGIRDKGFKEGMKAWILLLLNGYRIFAFGGNDSHGDLNRRRNVGVPFFSITETMNHTFGSVRTVVHAQSRKREDICIALKAGRAIVTEGPFINLSVASQNVVERPGGVVPRGVLKIQAIFQSSLEFGSLKTGKIYAGIAGETTEQTVGSVEYFHKDFEQYFESRYEEAGILYIRAECETVTGRFCFTNPVWIE